MTQSRFEEDKAMRTGSIAVLGLPLLVVTACAPAPKVDVETERASLLAADKAWSQMASDLDKVASVLADDREST